MVPTVRDTEDLPDLVDDGGGDEEEVETEDRSMGHRIMADLYAAGAMTRTHGDFDALEGGDEDVAVVGVDLGENKAPTWWEGEED
jgi:hypothetical protein